MATIAAQAQAAAITQIEADFYRVFTRWKRMAPWRDAVKGGEGSGFFGHAGRPGQRGGSAASSVKKHDVAQGKVLIEDIKAIDQWPFIQKAIALEAEKKRMRYRRGHYHDELSQDDNDRNDPYLADIIRQQGFDGLPESVSAEEYQALVDAGKIVPLFRGIDGEKSVQHVEQYRSGPLFVGEGIIGNGTYAARDRDRALKYASGPEGVLELGIRADAHTVDLYELLDMTTDWRKKMRKVHLDYSDDDPEPYVVDHLFSDPGRLAAMLGYDAISDGGIFVILNRTATVVIKKGGSA